MSDATAAAIRPRFSVRLDPDPLPDDAGPIELSIRTPGMGGSPGSVVVHHLSTGEAIDLSRRLVAMVPPEDRLRMRRPGRRSSRIVIPLELAGKWVAMDPDKTKILGHADSFQEIREMVGAGEDVLLSRVPDRRRWVPNTPSGVKVAQGGGDPKPCSPPPPISDIIPAEHAGKWVAWSPDGLRIVGHGETMEEAERIGGGGEDLVVAWAPALGGEQATQAERQAMPYGVDPTHDQLVTAHAELAEARRVLAMATAFDAGPLLGDVPSRWHHGSLDRHDAVSDVRISRRDDGSWFVALDDYESYFHPTDGWVWLDTNVDRPGFPSPAAALAALDAWRAARRAEIATAAAAANEAMDEMVRINQETGQYDDLRPNPMVRSGETATQQEEDATR